MCGIAGILRVWPADQRDAALATPHGLSIPEAWLDVLDDSIKHRGPDGQGRFRDRARRADGCVVDVALVHRRLSIIDHAGGHQPMLSLGKGQGVVTGVKRFSLGEGLGLYERSAACELSGYAAPQHAQSHAAAPDDCVCVVFNGCIYNHRELRAELQSLGHVFTTDHSDTEVLVHGWREWRNALYTKLNGMFALAVWSSTGVMSIARDVFGEKPLVYAKSSPHNPGLVLFSSALPGLLRLRDVLGTQTQADFHNVKPWIKFGWNSCLLPTPIGQELPSGMYTEFADEASKSDAPCAWTTCGNLLEPTNTPITLQIAESLLVSSVRSRLDADVPIATFLSGGLDSALISAIAKLDRPDITAFTVRMPDAAYDESSQAAETARTLGIQHSVLDCHPNPAADLIALVHQLGLPFGDSSLLPSVWVSRAAREHVSVALSGDGGDEMFLGYNRHRAIPWLQRLRSLPHETLDAMMNMAQSVISLPRHSFNSRLARLISAATGDGYKELVAIFPNPLDVQLGLRSHDQHGFGAIAHYGMTFNTQDAAMNACCALRFDRMFYLPCDLMRKSDTASMSVALEVRSPMLDLNLAQACINAPISSLMPHNQRKGLLRQVARKYLPAHIVDRPKMGFAIPIGEWFRSDFGGLRTMLLDHLNSSEPFGSPALGINLNHAFIRQMLDEHLGTGPSGLVKRDHSQRLYMLLVLSVWAKWLSALRTGMRCPP